MSWRQELVAWRLRRVGAGEVGSLLAGNFPAASWQGWRARWWRWLLAGLSAGEVFTLIYAQNLWGVSESRSGAGSTLSETESLRTNLPALLRQLEVRSLLDLPCGDFHWMSRLDLSGIDYLGADIVAELVARNQAEYGASGRRFLALDLLQDELPRMDAVLCRDCLVHLPNALVAQALRRLQASGATWLLVTTFPAQAGNPDIPLGLWRPVNLQAAPFHLPPPQMLLHEGNPDPRYADKSLGVWRLADLRLPPA
jgi:SAM-dependent methyltransferase